MVICFFIFFDPYAMVIIAELYPGTSAGLRMEFMGSG